MRNNTKSFSLDRNITDLVKFLASLLIATGHYLGYYSSIVEGGVNIFQKIILAQGGLLGVALFFFLSGYGLMKSEQMHHLSAIMFIKKRILKVYLPVFVSAIIWVPIWNLINGNLIANLWNIPLNIIWGWGDGILWFVKCLLILYAEFYIYTWVRKITAKDIVKVCSIIAMCCATFVYQYHIADYSAVSVPLFFIGITITDFQWINEVLSQRIGIGFLFMIMFVLFLVFRDNYLFIHSMFNYLIIFIWVFFSNQYNFTISPLPKWLGSFSFDIYLTHNKCLSTMVYYLACAPFWLFAYSTIAASILLYNLRRLLKI